MIDMNQRVKMTLGDLMFGQLVLTAQLEMAQEEIEKIKIALAETSEKNKELEAALQNPPPNHSKSRRTI